MGMMFFFSTVGMESSRGFILGLGIFCSVLGWGMGFVDGDLGGGTCWGWMLSNLGALSLFFVSLSLCWIGYWAFGCEILWGC